MSIGRNTESRMIVGTGPLSKAASTICNMAPGVTLCCAIAVLAPVRKGGALNSENSKANRIETMKGPAESGQICSVGRRKIAKKIAKNKRCYANTLRPRSRMLLKVMKGG
jgi:hypothetical protein